jgi:hypothetical protein
MSQPQAHLGFLRFEGCDKTSHYLPSIAELPSFRGSAYRLFPRRLAEKAALGEALGRTLEREQLLDMNTRLTGFSRNLLRHRIFQCTRIRGDLVRYCATMPLYRDATQLTIPADPNCLQRQCLSCDTAQLSFVTPHSCFTS